MSEPVVHIEQDAVEIWPGTTLPGERRIYVDGKRVSEEQYSKLVEQERGASA